MDEHGGFVGNAPVAKLAPAICRVHRMPEHRQQLGVCDLSGIVRHLQRFVMARIAGGDALIGRVLGGPARITGNRFEHARHLVEIGFNAPEASARERRDLCFACPVVLGVYRESADGDGQSGDSRRDEFLHTGAPVIADENMGAIEYFRSNDAVTLPLSGGRRGASVIPAARRRRRTARSAGRSNFRPPPAPGRGEKFHPPDRRSPQQRPRDDGG